MAKTETKKLERVYNIPLRHETIKSPKHRRSKKAITAIKEFISKHMKVDIENVKIGPQLNLKIWEHGIKNPPHHIKIGVVRQKNEDDVEVARVELEGIEFKSLKMKEKKVTGTGLKGKLDELKNAASSKESLEDIAEVKKDEKIDKKANKTNDQTSKPKKVKVEKQEGA